MLDPGTTRIDFRKYDDVKHIEVNDKPARIAFVMHTLELKPHIEIIDCAPGIYAVQCKRDGQRNWFRLEVVRSYLREPKQVGRYD